MSTIGWHFMLQWPNSGGSAMTHTRMTIEPRADAASGRPWGAWTSIAWVVAAVALWLLLSFWIVHSPSMGPMLVFLSWAIAPVVLVIAVLVRRLSIASY